MTMKGKNLAATAFAYGQCYEKRKQTPATDKHYRTYDALSIELWRELVEYGATDEKGKLKPILKAAMNVGRNTVTER